jgi:hypothetical protein
MIIIAIVVPAIISRVRYSFLEVALGSHEAKFNNKDWI